MRFGILGSLAVWTDEGGPVKVPEVKVRALLADLLTQPGRPVSTDRLIDDLWGDRPPGNPLGTLQARVSQLRKTLEQAEPGGRGLVVSQVPGYLLQVEPDAVDAGNFAALVARAHGAEDPRSKVTLLADALALWRGPAYADFADEEFARTAVVRLDEQRLTALEEHAEARLALGEHRLLTAELTDLVARHPLRERFRAAYLRALYRAGRSSEALATYGELRDRLRDELGLDPGPELVALHQAILEQDPALILAATASPGHRGPRLPAALSELIGRAEDVSEVCSLLKTGRYGGPRLVTLTGPGGVGKTRLAIETAKQVDDMFPDGVWLIELAALTPGSLHVVEVVAAALGLRDEAAAGAAGELEPASRLADALAARQALLVLDNCEHVIGPAAELVERLLKAAPGLQILLTSQEPLGLAGERVLAVSPLTLPDPETDPTPKALREFSAVRLFVARAEAAAPGFVLDAQSAPSVVAICRRLDGIPLALELAATRVRALGVRELAERLDDRFRVLAAGHRGAPARQQTLRAVIDWSWELLSEPERVVLRRLAVHAEGSTLDSAEAVCAGGDVRADEVLDALSRLVDRSLVVATDGPRYRLLESVAAYAVERLREAGEERLVRQRHGHYHVDLAERAASGLRGPGQRRWLELLDLENANLRVTLEYAVRDNDAHLALRLVNALAWHWYLRGRFGEARRSLDLALSVKGEAPAAIRAEAVTWQAGLTMMSGEGTEPTALIDAALRSYDGVDDPGGRARAEWFLSFVHWAYGDLGANEERVNRTLATFRSLGDRWGIAAALSVQANLAVVRGDLATMERAGAESLALFGELGDAWGRLAATDSLEKAAEITGDYERAGWLREEGLRSAEELGMWAEVSFKLAGLGRIAILTGDLDRARAFHERALRLAVEHSSRSSMEFAEIGLGLVARRQHRLDDAEAHLRSPLDWLSRVRGVAGTAFIMAELGFVAEQRGDAEAALALHLQGFEAADSTGDPRAVALALEGLAGAQALAGHPENAARLLGTAALTRASVGAPLPAAERGDVDRISAAVRKELGDDVFPREFAEGRTLTPAKHLINLKGKRSWV
jgi:predicted ATPase/DNA-binding SARP family transcriptional activator